MIIAMDTKYPDGDGVLQPLYHRKVYIETYGCRYNFGDSANLREILLHHGSTLVGSAEEADLVVVNTCTVVGPTERRMLRRLSQFRDRELYVTGCMPAVQLGAINAVCTPKVIPPEAIRHAYRTVKTVSGAGPGIVQVAQGCLGRCTYCITRLARGPLQSFSEDEIRDQVMAFARAGTAEIQLTAQDVSAWGRDAGRTLPDLLRLAGGVPAPSMLRVGMMNPATVLDILDDLIDAFRNDRIFRFLHLPAQSGSDRILRHMARGYCMDEYLEIVGAFRRKIPDLTLMTDMIVGFCDETEDEFGESLALLRRMRPGKVNVTRYSRRPHTPHVQGKELTDAVKKDRSRLMQVCAEEIYSQVNSPLLGTTLPVVITESIRPGSVMARTPAYIGVVINETLPVGLSTRVCLVEDRKYFFVGKRVGNDR